MIPVTKPFLPPQKEYDVYVQGIWERNWLTNNGPLVNELEQKVKKYLEQDNMLYLSNGTIALQIAIKALQLNGEIITTPFSYVATTSSIVWEGCVPVFVDIDPNTLNIDSAKIEAAITSKTTGIVATHVYGNPCDVDAIESIANRHNLKVVYDGAHGFGTRYKDKSIFSFGDVSTASFHATKLFHTIEGGAVFTKDETLLKRMSYMRNFGHDGPDRFNGVGINGKNSEFHAAMGLVNLNYVDSIIQERKELSDYYTSKLTGLNFRKPRIGRSVVYNYAYYPILLESEDVLLGVLNVLNQTNIFPRRYFYPSLHELPYVKSNNLTHASNAARTALCLPLYSGLKIEEIDLITSLIRKHA